MGHKESDMTERLSLHFHKFYNVGKLFQRHKLPKVTQEEMEKWKIIVSIKGIKFIVNDLLTKETPCWQILQNS